MNETSKRFVRTIESHITVDEDEYARIVDVLYGAIDIDIEPDIFTRSIDDSYEVLSVSFYDFEEEESKEKLIEILDNLFGKSNMHGLDFVNIHRLRCRSNR